MNRFDQKRLRDRLERALDLLFAYALPEAAPFAHERAGNIAGWLPYREEGDPPLGEQLARSLMCIADYNTFTSDKDHRSIINRIGQTLLVTIEQFNREHGFPIYVTKKDRR